MNTNYEHTWVFLSHSNKDFDKLVDVRNKLEKRGYRPLLFFLKCLEDENEISDLIKREIDARERFILCDSRNAQESEWVQKEVAYIRSTGRPYEVIDLEASKKVVEGRIERFDQRSTTYVWSTEDVIAGEVELLLSAKAFKVDQLLLSDKDDQLPDVVLTRTGNNDLLKGACFVVLVTCELSIDQAHLLNRFVKRFQMNAMAYRYSKTNNLEFKLDGSADNNGFRDGWDDLSFRKKDIIKTENSNVALTIVNDLMEWDKELYSNFNVSEQSKNAKDLLKRLNKYVKDHPLEVVLSLAIKRSAQERFLRVGWGMWKAYFDYLDEPVLLALLNEHALVKESHFESIYSCTDIEILERVLDDLVYNRSPEAVAANEIKIADEKPKYLRGVPVSAVRHFIEHLLSVNGIHI